MTFEIITEKIPESIKRFFSNAIARKTGPRRASDIELSTIAFESSNDIEGAGQPRIQRRRTIIEILSRRPATSDGITTAESNKQISQSPTSPTTCIIQDELDGPNFRAAVTDTVPDSAPQLSIVMGSIVETSPFEALEPCSQHRAYKEDEISGSADQDYGSETQQYLPLSNDMLFQLQSTFEVFGVVDKVGRFVEQQIAANTNYRQHIEDEISRQQILLSKLETRTDSDFGVQANHVSEKLEKLNSLMEESHASDRRVKMDIQSRYRDFQPMQQELIQALGNLAIQYGLFAATEIEGIAVEEPDFEAAYGYRTEHLDYGQFDQPDLSYQEDTVDTENAYLQAMHYLGDVQKEFDYKDLAEQEEETAIHEAYLETGITPDEDQEQFAARHLRRKMELTRKLIDAENHFAVAKKSAVDAGIDVHGLGEAEEEDDEEEEVIVDYNDSNKFDESVVQVKAWVTEIPENDDESNDAVSTPSVFDFPLSYPQEIEMWESGTDIAWDWRAEKILEWGQTCGTAMRNSRGRALSL